MVELRAFERGNVCTGAGKDSAGDPVPNRACHLAARIALVDDDDAVRRSLTRLLTCFGFAVVAFPSAEAFLDSGDVDGIGAVLLDVQLGGMSGTELSTRLLSAGYALPTVFISAADDAPEIVRARAGEDAVVLSKPLDSEQLQATLALALAGASIC